MKLSEIQYANLKPAFDSLKKALVSEYPFYGGWLIKNDAAFKNGTRKVYKIIADNNQLVGYLILHPGRNDIEKINSVYVFPPYEGKWYAQKSIQICIDYLKTIGYKYLFIQTKSNNEVVKHILNVLNFKIIGLNYHKEEKKDSLVEVFDINKKHDIKEMVEIASKIYPKFRAN